MPAGSALDLHSGDGSLSLDSISGTVKADTGDGQIRGTGLRSADVHVSSGDGSVKLQWAAAPRRVVATSGDGSMDLRVPAGSGPYAISDQTGDGATDTRVAVDPQAPRTMTLRTGDGNVTVLYGG